MKIACATQSEEEMRRFSNFLIKGYKIQNQDENFQNGQYSNVYTVEENPNPQRELFSILISETGIDPRKEKTKKNRNIVKVRRAACYILHYRFNLSHEKIAELMDYKSHASSLLICKDMKKVKVGMSISLREAVKNVLESLKGK